MTHNSPNALPTTNHDGSSASEQPTRSVYAAPMLARLTLAETEGFSGVNVDGEGGSAVVPP